jgi:hypothetical protein
LSQKELFNHIRVIVIILCGLLLVGGLARILEMVIPKEAVLIEVFEKLDALGMIAVAGVFTFVMVVCCVLGGINVVIRAFKKAFPSSTGSPRPVPIPLDSRREGRHG